MKSPALRKTTAWSGKPMACVIRLVLACLFLMPLRLPAASPVINTHPVSQTIFYGDPVSFGVEVSGTPPLYFQWYCRGLAVGGATTNVYALREVGTNDANATFFVVISNSSGAVTSQVATLTVDFGIAGPVQRSSLLTLSQVWKYNQTGSDPGGSWMTSGFDDSGSDWLSGPGVFDAKYVNGVNTMRATIGGQNVGTVLDMKPQGTNACAFYFRTHFAFHPYSGSVIEEHLNATALLDDGAAFYVNGREGYWVGVGSTAWNAWATSVIGDAALSYFELPLTNVVEGDNLISVEVHQANAGSSDITFGLALDSTVVPRLRDTIAPTLAELIPAPGTVPSLSQLEVHFSEGVKGVTAGSLIVNGLAATNVTAYSADVYVFQFPAQRVGNVQVSWNPAQTIVDLSANSNRFAGGTYSYTVDPLMIIGRIQLNEFMAGNSHTIQDDTGKFSDWFELYNANEEAVSLAGWYLTDNPAKLTKWRFPQGVVMPGKSYLVVWASGLDHTNPAAPLHTSFKLSQNAGSYLELVYSDGATVVSSFSPYPSQYPDVSYGRDRLDPSLVGYFTNATPGAPNAVLGLGMGPEVQFSVVSRTFQQPFSLVLSTADTNAVIRYLLVNGGGLAAATNVPTANSPIFTGPLTISGSSQVRARAFPTRAGFFPGPLHNETYLQIGSDITGFNSDLPIIVLHNMGGGAVPATVDQFTTMEVFDTRTNGRSSLLNPPDIAVQGVFHRRGQATLWNPKASLRVETQNEYGDNRNIALLGMPSDNDWVLYGIDQYDKSLMHNPLAHELYRQLGHYTSRTRFVEVFLKDDSGTSVPLTGGDYNGLYVLEEKIKIGANRVDIDELQPADTAVPAVTGGYLLSIDKWSSGDPPVLYAAGAAITYLNPDYYAITAQPAQEQYITDYLNSFYLVLNGPNWNDPMTGYPAYIDLSSWIDYHLHQTLLFNVDALRISAYFNKPRNGSLIQGPLWDFDRCFGTRTGDDGRGFAPRIWRSSEMDGGTDMFSPGNTFSNPWYGVLFTDPDFWQRWIDRYQELRKTTYSLSNITAEIDYFANQVRSATTREFSRWAGSGSSDTSPRYGAVTADGFTYVFPGTYKGEVDFTKFWFTNRLNFMDTNFLNPPVFSGNGGAITSGFPLTVTSSTLEPSSTIYYTLDGTDPRLPGGVVSPRAFSALNTANLKLTNNARVFARNWNPSHQNLWGGSGNPPLSSSWSGPTVATFIVSTPTLVITELMYDPAPPTSGTNDNDAYEFIELKNVGAQALNLVGIRFTNGIQFSFSTTNAITNLAAGGYVVLVRDLAGFRSRYPWVTNVAGQYGGKLSNSGDRLYLEGALKEPLLDFTYDSSWYPVTAHNGFSLVVCNESAPAYTWTNPASWRASAAMGGSPGGPDGAPIYIPPILITEALTHTDPPELDTVELYNPTDASVPLGGWFLTDDHAQPQKYRIANDVVIPPLSYLTFNESQFNNNGTNSFSLSSLGEEVYLFSGYGTNLTGYRLGFEFGAQHNGITFGRYVTSDGREHFVTETRNTLGAANAGPKVGPVVINEIMYSPPPFGLDADTVDEYVELRNFSGQTVPLYDPFHVTNTWSLSGAAQYSFPEGVTMAPWSYLLVVGFDPLHDPASLSWFRNRYGLDASVPIFGPWQGHLGNQGERIGLYEPDKPEVPPSPVAGFVPQVLIEDVHYWPVAPWPIGADGTGSSLQRIAPLTFADEPTNWVAAAPSPGRANPISSTVDSDQDGLPDEWELANGLDPLDPNGAQGAVGDLDKDGRSNWEEYQAETSPTNRLDFLKFDSARMAGASFELQFKAHGGRIYSVQYVNELAAPAGWQTLVDNLAGTNIITVTDNEWQSGKFYRLKVRLSSF